MGEVIVLLYVAMGVGFWGGLLYLGVRLVRALERRGGSRDELADLHARVARLEEDLAAATGEVARLEEAQRFTTALLAGRRADPPPT